MHSIYNQQNKQEIKGQIKNPRNQNSVSIILCKAFFLNNFYPANN